MSHRPAELRSIAIHQIVAARIEQGPDVLTRARERVACWLEAGELVPLQWARRWQELLDGPIDELQRMLVADTQEARDLRQVTPFAGVVSSEDRWRIVREAG